MYSVNDIDTGALMYAELRNEFINDAGKKDKTVFGIHRRNDGYYWGRGPKYSQEANCLYRHYESKGKREVWVFEGAKKTSRLQQISDWYKLDVGCVGNLGSNGKIPVRSIKEFQKTQPKIILFPDCDEVGIKAVVSQFSQLKDAGLDVHICTSSKYHTGKLDKRDIEDVLELKRDDWRSREYNLDFMREVGDVEELLSIYGEKQDKKAVAKKEPKPAKKVSSDINLLKAVVEGDNRDLWEDGTYSIRAVPNEVGYRVSCEPTGKASRYETRVIPIHEQYIEPRERIEGRKVLWYSIGCWKWKDYSNERDAEG